jgi:Tfp pilus assembly protein PilO
MKLEGKSRNLTIGAMLALAALAIAFWMLALSPKRDELKKLDGQVERVESSLAQHQAEVAAGEEARREFSSDYQTLVVLGKAVPGDDDTASLLVQVSGIAERAGVRFRDIHLSSSGEGSTEAAPAPTPGSEPVSATEAAASLLPLGAAIGPAGLGVMPYTLTFDGSFFQIADFIKGLDSLVKTQAEKVAVDGRLITIDGFSLKAGDDGFPALTASFSVTTYLTPPSQGLAGGATPASPGAAVATPAATTLGGAP